MTLASQAADSVDPAFLAVVQQAIVTAAIQISAEAVNVPNHVNRVTFAKAVLSSPAAFAPIMAQGVASQQVNKLSTDAAISAAVAAIWDDYAGKL